MTTSYLDDKYTRSKAADYLRGQLQQGKTLAALLLEHIDFLQGTVAVLTAVPLSAKDRVAFDHGHLSSPQGSMRTITLGEISGTAFSRPSANAQLVELIGKSLGQEDNICLLENSLAAPEDPWLKRASSRIAIYGSEVYHLLTSADRDRNSISASIREAQAPTVLVGALGRAPADINSRIARRFDVNRTDLEEFARLSQCVFALAYDGEGYVVWFAHPTDDKR